MCSYLLLIANFFLIAYSVSSVTCVSKWDQFMSNLDDFGDTIGGTACLPSVARKSYKCIARFDTKLESRPDGENDVKYMCCAFVALRDCIKKVASKECTQNVDKVATSVIDHIDKAVTSDDCKDYNYYSCMTITQILLLFCIAVAVLFLLALVCCVACYCCKLFRRRRSRSKRLTLTNTNQIEDTHAKSLLA